MYPNRLSKWHHRCVLYEELIMPVNPIPDNQFIPYPPPQTDKDRKKAERIFLSSSEQKAAAAAAALERRNSDPVKPNAHGNERVNELRRLYKSYGIDFPNNPLYRGRNGGEKDEGVPFFKFCAPLKLVPQKAGGGDSNSKPKAAQKGRSPSDDPNDDVGWGDKKLETPAEEDKSKHDEAEINKRREEEAEVCAVEAAFKPSYIDLPRLRTKEEFGAKEMITSPNKVGAPPVEPAKITYVDIQLDTNNDNNNNNNNNSSSSSSRYYQRVGTSTLSFSRRFRPNAQIAKHLGMYSNLMVLVARGCGITNLKEFKMPNLRYCDLANNRISVIEDVEAFASRSKNIEVLNLVGNEVSANPEFYSRVKKYINNCLIIYIRYLNFIWFCV